MNTLNGGTPWQSSNDGSGSGLDADLLDGVQGSGYVRANSTSAGNIDADWGQSFKTFDPIPSGTPPIPSPNLRTINIGENYARRTQVAFNYATDQAWFRRRHNTTWHGWNQFFHTGNDGSGSGLDADLLDGVQGSGYVKTTGTQTIGGVTTFSSGANALSTAGGAVRITGGLGVGYNVYANAFLRQGNTVWDVGNDGSGSGLDADLLDGVQGSGYVNTTGTQTIGGVKTFSSNLTAGGRVYIQGSTTNFLGQGPYSSTNLGINFGSSLFFYSGTTQLAFFSTTNAWFNKKIVVQGATTQTAATPNIQSIAQGSGNGVTQYHINFCNSGQTVHGRITSNNFSTTYATTSDYRVKEDVQEMEGATERLLQLNPVNFKWKGSEIRTDGFLAHEVDAIVPDAVVGVKDATEEVTDDEGVTTTIDSLQALDQAKLVPLLIKTIQELEARITALENA